MRDFGRIKDATPYFNFAAEHKCQSLNSTPSTTLERDLGFVATRNQYFTSGDTPYALDSEEVRLHPFACDAIIISQRKKMQNAMEDTATKAATRYYSVRNHVRNLYLLPTPVPTSLNVADLFTKAIPEFSTFDKHRRACGLIDYEDGA